MEVALSPEQEERLREIARTTGKPVEVLAGDLLKEAIAQHSSAARHRPVPVPPELHLAHLRGLGKEVWRGEDAQAYVNRLRQDEWR